MTLSAACMTGGIPHCITENFVYGGAQKRASFERREAKQQWHHGKTKSAGLEDASTRAHHERHDGKPSYRQAIRNYFRHRREKSRSNLSATSATLDVIANGLGSSNLEKVKRASRSPTFGSQRTAGNR